jgi:hypothetical protein
MSHGQDYYANYGGVSVSDYVERHVRGSASEMERMRRTVELVPPGVKSLLDVGAGHGVFLEELKAARGIAGVGIEITSAKVDYARARGIDLRLGDASKLDFATGEFDAVVSCEVLEHLPYGVYEAALRELARVAREWVIVTVPFDEHRRFVRCPYCGASVNPDYHFRAFAPGSMEGLIPGFRLHETLQLGWQRRSPLVELGRRFVSRWPRFLVCPSCTYSEPSVTPSQADAAANESSAMALARRLAGWVPARGRPVWLVGVFRKDGAHA